MDNPVPNAVWLNKDISEDALLRDIAYYKARLVDIRNAPPHSKHSEGWAATRDRLEECQRMLAALRRQKRLLNS